MHKVAAFALFVLGAVCAYPMISSDEGSGSVTGWMLGAMVLVSSGAVCLLIAVNRQKKWDMYESLIRYDGNTYIPYIVRETGIPEDKVIDDINEMISKNFLIGPGADRDPYIDRESGYIAMVDYETGLMLEPIPETDRLHG